MVVRSRVGMSAGRRAAAFAGQPQHVAGAAMTLPNLIADVRDEVAHAEQAVRLRAALYEAELRHPGLRARFEALAERAHNEASAVLDGQLAHTELGDIAGAWA